jgi:hypothetical protein
MPAFQNGSRPTSKIKNDADAELLSEEEILQQAAHDLVDRLGRTAWTKADAPPVAQWIDENEEPLDLLVQASAKPQFFSPGPNLLEDPKTPLVESLLPGIQAARSASRSLVVRATFRLGNGEHDKAWDDCLAVWRLGAQVAKGSTLVEKLVAIAIRGVACNSTLTLLQTKGIREELLQRVLRDLNALDESLNSETRSTTASGSCFSTAFCGCLRAAWAGSPAT